MAHPKRSPSDRQDFLRSSGSGGGKHSADRCQRHERNEKRAVVPDRELVPEAKVHWKEHAKNKKSHEGGCPSGLRRNESRDHPARDRCGRSLCKSTDLHGQRKLQGRLCSVVAGNCKAQAEVEKGNNKGPGNQSGDDAPGGSKHVAPLLISRLVLV